MIRSLLSALLALGLTAAPAFARDNRLVSRLYNKDEIVRVEARIGVQAVISFGEDELIENVAIGDSTNWQITPNKRANLLFVKPVVQRTRTNLTVVTDRHTYFFDLVAGGSAAPVYELRFTYPPSPKPAADAATPPALTPEESAIAQGGAAAVPVDPAQLNFAWRATGSSRVMPSRIFDDGQSTYLSWPAGVSLPAILVRDPKGAEGPVNFSVRGDVIAVDGVPPLLVLRSGREQAILEYKGAQRAEPPAPPGPPGEKGN